MVFIILCLSQMLLFGKGWPPVVSAGAPGRNITFSNGFHRPLWLIRTAARAPSTQLPFGGKLEMLILLRVFNGFHYTMPCLRGALPGQTVKSSRFPMVFDRFRPGTLGHVNLVEMYLLT